MNTSPPVSPVPTGNAFQGGPVLVTVVICTRNRVALLEQAIRSVRPGLSAESELLVVDNGSTDATPRVLERAKGMNPRVRSTVERKVGLSGARNRGLREARGEFVVFLDDDAEADPGWLEAYVQAIRDGGFRGAGVLVGAVRPRYGGVVPRWYDPAWDTLDLGPRPRRLGLTHLGWGCNIGYRRAAALEAGGFDVRLGRNGRGLGAHEEADLTRRLLQRGAESWWIPAASIQHQLGVERLRMNWQLRHLFDQGRSSAVVRLDACGWRLPYVLGRLLAAPVQGALLLLLASVSFLAGRLRRAARSVLRAARVAGFSYQLVHVTGPR